MSPPGLCLVFQRQLVETNKNYETCSGSQFKPNILKWMKKTDFNQFVHVVHISGTFFSQLVYIYYLLKVRFLKPASRAQEVALWVCTSNLVWYPKIRRQRHWDLSWIGQTLHAFAKNISCMKSFLREVLAQTSRFKSIFTLSRSMFVFRYTFKGCNK